MAAIVEHKIRTRDGGKITITLNRGKAIKAMCTECMGFESDPKSCTDKHCPLYPWRGKLLAGYKMSEERDQ